MQIIGGLSTQCIVDEINGGLVKAMKSLKELQSFAWLTNYL